MSVKHILALVVAAIGTTACDTHQPLTAPVSGASFGVNGAPGPSVSGHAEFTGMFPIGPVVIRYSLNAVTQGNGDVTGEVEFRARGLAFPLDVRWHATVLCLTVSPDGKTAGVGARIDAEALDVGFILEDNGEGPNDPPDRASPAGPRPDDPVRGALDHCAGKTLPLPLTAIERGNIQVRP